MPPLNESETQAAPRHGLVLLQVLALGFFFLFVFRFWQIQVHWSEEFVAKSQDNQLRQELVFAPRGELRDRHGELLAVNQAAYALAIVREDVKDLNGTLLQVSQWTGIPLDQIRERFDKGRSRVKPFQQLILVPDLTFELVALIEANSIFWPGLEIVVRPRRVYLQGPLLAHILGYVAEANPEEMDADPDLSMGDLTGRQGLEKVMELSLRGKKGLKQMEVDATGRSLQQEVLRPPKSGDGLTLAIDLKLQSDVTMEMQGQAGGVAVMDPDTGEVLALVTQPTYDNNVFTSGITAARYGALQANPRHPLLNRVIQSVYPPGSVWKLVTAAAGLQEGLINLHSSVSCPGYYTLGGRQFRCWKKGGHGGVDLMGALVHSCDVYFYQLAERLGVERLSRYASAMGFGQPTGIDLPNEKGGLVPTPEWKRKRFREPWHGGETLNYGIGQGFAQVTPLQVARFISALVNGGKLLKPQMLAGRPPEVQGKLPISDGHRKILVESMVRTVESGTAKRIMRSDVVQGAKTGTAQVVKLGQERKKTRDTPYKYRDHAWMASFGEKAGQSYVVVTMVEHGGHGGSIAGPVVRAVYEDLFGPAPGKNATAANAATPGGTRPANATASRPANATAIQPSATVVQGAQ